MTIALTFPGQGSQSVGMGSALADGFAPARAVFEEVDEALGEPLSTLMREGPADTLTLTRNAQPAIFAASMALVRVLEAERGLVVGSAHAVAGHSLGEYTALATAGSLDVAVGARLLRLRGDAMQSAVAVGRGAMAALLGADFAQAEAACAAAVAAGEVCEIANDNAPGQIVISGTRAGVDAAIEAARGMGVRKAMLLPVSAPFHCSLMAPAAEAMRAALADVTLRPPSLPVFTNVTAAAESDPGVLRARLVEQVTGRVRWRETVVNLVAAGATRLVEIGAGKVLTPMAKRIVGDGVSLETVTDGAEIAGFAVQ
jgi:[acyl-carrier-protein] S-malonyltransferase